MTHKTNENQKVVSRGKQEKQRTLTQNAALHLYFQMVADALNEAGLNIQVIVRPGMEIEWSQASVKDILWRIAQRVRLGKQSTAALTTKEIDIVFDEVNRHLSQFGISIPFPSYDEMANSQL